jgi:hypothetical protein
LLAKLRSVISPPPAARLVDLRALGIELVRTELYDLLGRQIRLDVLDRQNTELGQPGRQLLKLRVIEMRRYELADPGIFYELRELLVADAGEIGRLFFRRLQTDLVR